MGNKYQSIDNLERLNSVRPTRRPSAKGPSLANFVTTDNTLKQWASFALEMGKFFSPQEQRLYSGAVTPPEGLSADEREGAGIGASFKNLDFEVEAAEWNHLRRADSQAFDPTSNFVADRAYYVNDILSAIGSSWSEVRSLLSRPPLAGKSYYQIVMDGSYRSLSPRDAFLFATAMDESRERVFGAMTAIFGSANQTRDDQAMIRSIDSFINSHNPTQNNHALLFLESLLFVAESSLDNMTTFYEEHAGDGARQTTEERTRFWEFSQWLGRETFDGIYNTTVARNAATTATERDRLGREVSRLEREGVGRLYEFKRSCTGSAATAANTLLGQWFGATKVENGRPLWEGYDAPRMPNPRDPNWVNLEREMSFVAEDGTRATAVKAYITPNPSYSWDRKWEDHLEVQTADGHVYRVKTNDASWAQIMNQLWRQHSITSYINPALRDNAHPNDTTQQGHSLSFGALTSGAEFNNNWANHALGRFLSLRSADLNGVVAQIAISRRGSLDYRRDVADYRDRKGELQDKQYDEQKALAEAASRAQANKKKPAKSSSSTGNQQQNYQKAMQKFRLRILNASKKHRQNLEKNKSTDKR